MPKRPYDLPPLSALSSFEAAARHESFKSAAQELNVTPAAISHQVKALEAELGQQLFHRHQRGVELSETGQMLQLTLQRGFEQISTMVTQLRQDSQTRAVTIGATTAVSSLWLTPRLARFWKRHGNIAVTQNVSDTDHAQTGCNLSIHYGDMTRDNGDCRPLFRDRIAALASPAFAAEHAVDALADLAHLPLIHLNASDERWTDWRTWCAALDYDGPIGEGLRVNNYTIALQAAQDDMGVVLGWNALTAPLVQSGALVPLLPQDIAAPLDFYIKTHASANERAILLRDWLLTPQAL
ncbi:LysR family transcriptional regulator [Tropicibacter sp. R16_0]|uniref:LysR substrate-binding domain-containing protein n=1 Tax=Tropicibacter sp. R16_0 TaxID=2821102 RepID=UPI001AD9D0BE|nr:LysR substrate-binding domain-containing protein [Tropicibacter sp. R16_0]MBO9449292.1 LysR family transcriptional regulator [Tropicibacter sp. R16_0]